MSHRRAWLPLKSRCLRGPPRSAKSQRRMRRRFSSQDTMRFTAASGAADAPGCAGHAAWPRPPRGAARAAGGCAPRPASSTAARVRAGAAGLRRQPPQPLPAEPAPPFVVRGLPDPLAADCRQAPAARRDQAGPPSTCEGARANRTRWRPRNPLDTDPSGVC